MPSNILFTYQIAFSANGGIQNFNRCFIKALDEQTTDAKTSLTISSFYDKSTDANYFKKGKFITYPNKYAYVLSTVLNAHKYDLIILGHVNMALIGVIIKLLFPKKQVWVITHGVEVWMPSLGFLRNRLLDVVDKIIAVSQYTKDQMVFHRKINADKISIFYNTINPFFEVPTNFEASEKIKLKYGFPLGSTVLLTVTRIDSNDKYKGYDIVLEAMSKIATKDIFYIIGGKYDAQEKARIDTLIESYQLQNQVILPGYISDSDLVDYYKYADIFIMPSKGEGFGIVFIEAAVCGAVVIGGNKDGSVDALQNGEYGILVDPDNVIEVKKAIERGISHPLSLENKFELQKKVMSKFGFHRYKENLKHLIETIS
jgi:phosphatidyl-myo-inositol dimannoside synthase